MPISTNDVTLGIISADRYRRLESLLSSLPLLPQRFNVIVIDNSKKKEDISYLVGLLIRNGFVVKVLRIKYGKSMFALRQMLLNLCKTKFLWYLDDDVILTGNPLSAFLNVDTEFGFLQGSKIDLLNTEKYTDWAIDVTYMKMSEGGIPCWFYRYKFGGIVETCVMDCGNVFIDVEKARQVGGFRYTGNKSLVGRTGEDVLMGARLASCYTCVYVSDSVVFHLPLSKMRFIDKNPKWLWDVIVKECTLFVQEKLYSFYKRKFKW